MRTNHSKSIFWILSVTVVFGVTVGTAHAQQQPPTVISLTQGTGWGLPGALTFDVDESWWLEENTIPGQVAMQQFNPAWGTLLSAVLTIQSVNAEYTWHLDAELQAPLDEFQDLVSEWLLNSWEFKAEATIAFEGGALSGSDTGGNPDFDGLLDIPFPNQIVPISGVVGTDLFTITLEQTLSSDGLIDANFDGLFDSYDFDDIEIGGYIQGVFSGIATMTYNFIPSVSPLPPPPGDATMNNIVNRSDFNVVVGNLGRNDAATGWNHGDFDQDGDVDLSDYVSLQDNFLVGDMNGDETLDSFDASPFELALSDIEAYNLQYPDLIGELLGDVNSDASFDVFDIFAFEALLNGGGATTVVPEPVSFALVAGGCMALMFRRRAA